MNIFRNANYDFIRWRWHAIVLSLIVVAAGVAAMAIRGLPLGIDFSGGTALIVKFEQAVTEDQVRQAVDAGIAGDYVVQQFGNPGDREWLIRLPQAEAVESGRALEQGAQQIEAGLQKAGLPKFEVISREVVGPVIGADLQR